jgi:hypothetical protein
MVGSHKFAFGFFGSVLLVWLVGMTLFVRQSALPPEASGTMMAVFDPSTTQEAAVAAIIKAGGNVVKKSGLDFVWVVQGDAPGLAGNLKAAGALGAYRELPISPALAGCFAVVDAKVDAAFD